MDPQMISEAVGLLCRRFENLLNLAGEKPDTFSPESWAGILLECHKLLNDLELDDPITSLDGPQPPADGYISDSQIANFRASIFSEKPHGVVGRMRKRLLGLRMAANYRKFSERERGTLGVRVARVLGLKTSGISKFSEYGPLNEAVFRMQLNSVKRQTAEMLAARK